MGKAGVMPRRPKAGAYRLEAARDALALWRIQSLDQIGWALDVIEQSAPDQPSRQAELWFYLRCAIDHPANDGADWSLAWLPADLHQELLEALAALPFGEVRPILEPAKAGKHGAAYSANVARMVAVQHVEFLHGQGYTKTKAREIVATTMGEEAATIRSWKNTLLPKVIGKDRVQKALAAAHEAGRLSDTLAAIYSAGDGPLEAVEQVEFDGAVTVHTDVLDAYDRHSVIDLEDLGRSLRATP